MNIELKTYSTPRNLTGAAAARTKRPPLSLFRRTPADRRTREIARAAAIEVLG